MRFYCLQRGDFKLWKGWGIILAHGITAHLPRKDGMLQLERTAPFIPPITLPGVGVVVTAALHKQLEQSGFPGLTFRPVIKARIVELHWEDWDRSTPWPPELPQSGEAADYILSRPHSPAAAKQMGDLWEWILPEDAEVEGTQERTSDEEKERTGRRLKYRYKVHAGTWKGAAVFHPKGKVSAFVTGDAKDWIEQRADRWISFNEAEVLE